MNLTKNCSVCKLNKKSGCKSPKLEPVGAPKPKYIIVSSCPSTSEDNAGKLMGGRQGKDFKKLLVELGFNLEEVLFTNAVRCKPVDAPTRIEVELCGETVRDLIELHKPDGVVLMSEDAVRAVFPKSYPGIYAINRVRGSKVPYFTKSGKCVTCVATLRQSSFVDSDQALKQVWYDDIASLLEPVNITVPLKPKIIICKTFDLVKECAAKLKKESIVAFDFETTQLKPYGQSGKVAELFSVAFAFDDGSSYAIPLFNYYPSNMRKAIDELICEFFYGLNPTQRKIGHNTKFDMIWGLYKAGHKLEKTPQGKWEDTSLLCWINDGRAGMSKLKVAAWKYFGVNDWSVDVKDVRSLPLDDVLKYNALDSFYTLRLYQHLEPSICSDSVGESLYRDLLLPSMLQFLKIEMRGVPVDEVLRAEFHKDYQNRIDSLIRDIRADVGKVDLNPNSSKQLQKYFIDECGYKLIRKTKTGYSTDDEALNYVVDKYSDSVARKVLQFRGVSKLQSTYIAGMSKHIYSDKRLHGGFNLTATVTGRTSSNEPNMQNFPKRKNKEVRGIVSAPAGYKLCSFDYGQIEARLFAIVTGDENYLSDLYDGYDIHLETALWIYRDNLGWSEEDAKKKRGAIKNGAVFPAFYGAGDNTISSSLEIPLDLARAFKKRLFNRYKKVKEWQREIVGFEEQYGYIESLYGRTRRAPMKYNELLNFTTQSTASDMTLTAMNYLGRRYDIAFMIHDDLSIFLKDNAYLQHHIDYICDAMLVLPWVHLGKSDLMREFAPLQVECEVGTNWANQQPVKAIDNIEAGYKDIDSCIDRAEVIIDELMLEGW